MRTGSDYDDFYILSKKSIVEQFENAQFFIDTVQKLFEEMN